MHTRFRFSSTLPFVVSTLIWLTGAGELSRTFGQVEKSADSSSTRFPLKVDRDHYPSPEHRYKDAKIGISAENSKPDFPPPKSVPEGAPNILLVLLDDVGFGCSSAFGGTIQMPTADWLAKAGLKYNAFHTTALCSPTRAALITGRNHRNRTPEPW